MDAAAFPQIYQRDDGGHLHLGVLLPGFSERDNLSMTVRAQLRTPRSFLFAVPLASGEARRPKETGGQPGTGGFSPPAPQVFCSPPLGGSGEHVRGGAGGRDSKVGGALRPFCGQRKLRRGAIWPLLSKGGMAEGRDTSKGSLDAHACGALSDCEPSERATREAALL
eukprot:scaffold9330_cov117-Isochrysis_galbana.AAC.4